MELMFELNRETGTTLVGATMRFTVRSSTGCEPSQRCGQSISASFRCETWAGIFAARAMVASSSIASSSFTSSLRIWLA